MKPSEVRARVLKDHEGLRRDLERLERLTREVRRSDSDGDDVRELRREATTFLEKLRAHMRWEELYLLPVLRDADAWGEERARRLVSDHEEQRELLDFIRDRLRNDQRPEPLLFSDVFALIAFLREDMEEEERDLLDERVVRDDVIGIQVEAG